jgi:hypothetical protein
VTISITTHAATAKGTTRATGAVILTEITTAATDTVQGTRCLVADRSATDRSSSMNMQTKLHTLLSTNSRTSSPFRYATTARLQCTVAAEVPASHHVEMSTGVATGNSAEWDGTNGTTVPFRPPHRCRSTSGPIQGTATLPRQNNIRFNPKLPLPATRGRSAAAFCTARGPRQLARPAAAAAAATSSRSGGNTNTSRNRNNSSNTRNVARRPVASRG